MSKTIIIADSCSNHLGDRRLMEQMIIEAKNAGVDIIKFQSFNPERLNKNWPNYEKAKEYYKSVALTDSDHVFILDKCKEVGIEPLFTAFDVERADFIARLGMETVKIASPDAENVPLLEYCEENFKRIYISFGMTNHWNAQRMPGYEKFYCVSRYPAPLDSIDFNAMSYHDGFSDHTADITASKKAIDMGIQYVERHFTLGKYLPGKDHRFSSTPDEFKELCDYRDYKHNVQLYKTRWKG